MLLHLRPQLYGHFLRVDLHSVVIEPLGLMLRGGHELMVRRPHPNKRWRVACRRGRKGFNGILVEAPACPSRFVVATTWEVECMEVVTHRTEYRITDDEHDAASDCRELWLGHLKRAHPPAEARELGEEWEARFPPGLDWRSKDNPRPALEWGTGTSTYCGHALWAGQLVPRDPHEGWLALRQEFRMPTIERERLLTSWVGASVGLPRLEHAFMAGEAVG